MNWCLELQLLIQEPARNFRWLFSFSLKMFGKSYVAALHNWIYPPAHVPPSPALLQPTRQENWKRGRAPRPVSHRKKEKREKCSCVTIRFLFFSFFWGGRGAEEAPSVLFCSYLYKWRETPSNFDVFFFLSMAMRTKQERYYFSWTRKLWNLVGTYTATYH